MRLAPVIRLGFHGLWPAMAAVLLACDMNQPPSSASLAIVNARVWTGDSARPWAEAIAINGDTIVAVGSSAEVRKLGAERVVDAKGGMVTPGFIDSHVHFVTGGVRLSSVQLRVAKTPEEFVRRIREFAATVPAGTWITGGYWDHEQWGGALPERSWLDSIAPEHPVWVNRLDGHMALANSAALTAANVSAATRDVEGGAIVRANGQPTGILKDNAQALVDRAVPEVPEALQDRALDTATTYAASNGGTSVHNMGSWWERGTSGPGRAATR